MKRTATAAAMPPSEAGRLRDEALRRKTAGDEEGAAAAEVLLAEAREAATENQRAMMEHANGLLAAAAARARAAAVAETRRQRLRQLLEHMGFDTGGGIEWEVSDSRIALLVGVEPAAVCMVVPKDDLGMMSMVITGPEGARTARPMHALDADAIRWVMGASEAELCDGRDDPPREAPAPGPPLRASLARPAPASKFSYWVHMLRLVHPAFLMARQSAVRIAAALRNEESSAEMEAALAARFGEVGVLLPAFTPARHGLARPMVYFGTVRWYALQAPTPDGEARLRTLMEPHRLTARLPADVYAASVLHAAEMGPSREAREAVEKLETGRDSADLIDSVCWTLPRINALVEEGAVLQESREGERYMPPLWLADCVSWRATNPRSLPPATEGLSLADDVAQTRVTAVIEGTMGIGKTHAIRRFLDETVQLGRSGVSFCQITPRRLFARQMAAEMPAGASVVSYLDADAPKDMSGCDRQLVSPESMHRNARRRAEGRPFNVVLLDEATALAVQAMSATTNGAHHAQNLAVLEWVIRSANIVIIADAIFTESLGTFLELRLGADPDVPRAAGIYYYRHTSLPPLGRARQLVPYTVPAIIDAATGATLQRAAIIPPRTQLLNEIEAALCLPRINDDGVLLPSRLVCCAASADVAERFVTHLRKYNEPGTPQMARRAAQFVAALRRWHIERNALHVFEWRYGDEAALAAEYEEYMAIAGGAVSVKIKFHALRAGRSPEEELADVNRHWSAEECNVLVYTSVITVGVNYDPVFVPPGDYDAATATPEEAAAMKAWRAAWLAEQRYDYLFADLSKEAGTVWQQIQMLRRVRRFNPGADMLYTVQARGGAAPNKTRAAVIAAQLMNDDGALAVGGAPEELVFASAPGAPAFAVPEGRMSAFARALLYDVTLEAAVSREPSCFGPMVERMLRASGYTLVDALPPRVLWTRALEVADAALPPLESVPGDAVVVHALRVKVFERQPLTRDEQLILSKAALATKFGPPFWEEPAHADAREFIWRHCVRGGDGRLSRPFVELEEDVLDASRRTQVLRWRHERLLETVPHRYLFPVTVAVVLEPLLESLGVVLTEPDGAPSGAFRIGHEHLRAMLPALRADAAAGPEVSRYYLRNLRYGFLGKATLGPARADIAFVQALLRFVYKRVLGYHIRELRDATYSSWTDIDGKRKRAPYSFIITRSPWQALAAQLRARGPAAIAPPYDAAFWAWARELWATPARAPAAAAADAGDAAEEFDDDEGGGDEFDASQLSQLSAEDSRDSL